MPVKDNGIGMKAEDRATIFEKFRRANKLVDGSGVALFGEHDSYTGRCKD